MIRSTSNISDLLVIFVCLLPYQSHYFVQCQKLSQVLLKHLFCCQFESKFNLNGINYSKCLKYTNSLLELIFLVSLQFRGDK